MFFLHECSDVKGRNHQLEVEISCPEFRIISAKADIPEIYLYRLRRAVNEGIELSEIVQLFEEVSIPLFLMSLTNNLSKDYR